MKSKEVLVELQKFQGSEVVDKGRGPHSAEPSEIQGVALGDCRKHSSLTTHTTIKRPIQR